MKLIEYFQITMNELAKTSLNHFQEKKPANSRHIKHQVVQSEKIKNNETFNRKGANVN